MANEILRFRYGVKADLPTSKTAGQLLFATYQDAKSGKTEAKIYFDTTSEQRIILSNDVDRARSLFSGVTSSATADGAWTAEIEGVSSLYDGLTIAIKLSRGPNPTYNTLNINGLGAKLVWDSYGTRLTNQHSIYDELILVYRDSAGSYTTPASTTGTPNTLSASTSYTSGWIVLNSGKSLDTNTTIENHDLLIIADASDNYKLKSSSISFDGTTTNLALSKKGTWEKVSYVTLKEWGSET